MRILLLLLCFALSACLTDVSSKEQAPEISVVDLNRALVLKLNADGYRPKQLPQAVTSVAASNLPPLPKWKGDAKIEAILPEKTTRWAYRIGTKDQITLSSPSEDQDARLQGLIDAKARRAVYHVRGDGTISVPGLNPIPVSGLTLKDAEEAVFDALITNNLEPNLSFELTGYHSQSATVSGHVGTPTVTPISSNTLYLDQALQKAGGVSSGNLDRTIVRIYRRGESYQLSARDALSGKYGRIALEDADNIVVEPVDEVSDLRRNFAHREASETYRIKQTQLTNARQNFRTQLELGAVQADKAYVIAQKAQPVSLDLPFQGRAMLADAISSTHSQEAFNHVYLLRIVNNQQHVFHVDLRQSGNLFLTTALELRPKDFVVLSDSLIRNWEKSRFLRFK